MWLFAICLEYLCVPFHSTGRRIKGKLERQMFGKLFSRDYPPKSSVCRISRFPLWILWVYCRVFLMALPNIILSLSRFRQKIPALNAAGVPRYALLMLLSWKAGRLSLIMTNVSAATAVRKYAPKTVYNFTGDSLLRY